jgi:hypothetical protein
VDYLSCILTLLSTAMVGKKRWEGFVIASVNSVLICLIAHNTHQWGLIPANLFCIGLYLNNIHDWRKQGERGNPEITRSSTTVQS